MNIVLGSNYESIVSETKRLANKTSALKSKLSKIRTSLDDAYDGQIDYDSEIKTLEKRLYTQQTRMSNLSKAINGAFDELVRVDSGNIVTQKDFLTNILDKLGDFGGSISSLLSKYGSDFWNRITSCFGIAGITGAATSLSAISPFATLQFSATNKGGNSVNFFSSFENITNQTISGIDIVSEIKSKLGDLEDLADIWNVFGDSEFAEEISEYAGGLKKNTVLKVFDYIDDGVDVIEAFQSGDADKIEGMIEKYSKKIIGSIGASGAGGAGGIYINLAWNVGKGIGEGYTAISNDPSLSTVAGAVYGATIGAVVETGVDLGADVLDFAYTLVGKDFDEEDYDMAMNYLGNQIVNGANAVVDTVSDAVEAVGDAAGEFVDKAGEVSNDFGDAVSDAAGTFSDWFGKLF